MREYPNKMRKPEWDARVRLPEVVRPPRARGGRRRRRSHGGGMLSPGPPGRGPGRGSLPVMGALRHSCWQATEWPPTYQP